MECVNELVGRHTGLLEQADECADFHFAMIWDDATHGAATHDDMAAALEGNHETESFQCSDDLGTGNDRKLRHEREPGR